MKYVGIFLLLIACYTATANTDTLKYYVDFENKRCSPEFGYLYRTIWKEGNYWHAKDYYVQEKTLQMDGTFADSALLVEHGLFNYYHTNGELETKERYKMGELQGWALSFDEQGHPTDSLRYKDGVLIGHGVSRYRTGEIAGIYDFDDKGIGSGMETQYHRSGNISARGKWNACNIKDSIWTYYHYNGRVACVESYKNGELQTEQFFDTSGNPQKKARKPLEKLAIKRKEAMNFLEENFIRSGCLQEVKNKKGVLIVRYTVDEFSKWKFEVLKSYHPCADKIMLSLFEKSVSSLSNIDHNRTIESSEVQAVNFPPGSR